MRRVAVNIGPLFRLDGQPQPMTGVHQYVDSLVGALLAAAPQSAFNKVTPFAPLGASSALDEAERAGMLGWRENARMDTAGAGPLLRHHPPTLAERARVRVGLLQASRAAQRYDVMHACAPSYLPLARLKGRRNVATVFDLTTRKRPDRHTADNVAAWETYYGFVVRHADRVVTLSEASRADITEHLGVAADRIAVTPLAPRRGTKHVADSAARRALLAPLGVCENTAAPFVLYAGTLEPRKNLATLVRAFALVGEATPVLRGLRLVLAGGTWSGEHADALRRLSGEKGVADRVVMPGYVENDTMNALMSACAVFAYVSHDEGFGMPPLEAMACGAPVVVSNVSSLPEVVGEAGIQVSPRNEQEIAGALHGLLTDPAENARQRALSRARAARFSWERTAAETMRCYEEAGAS